MAVLSQKKVTKRMRNKRVPITETIAGAGSFVAVGGGVGGSWLDKYFTYDETNKILQLLNPDGGGVIDFSNTEGGLLSNSNISLVGNINQTGAAVQMDINPYALIRFGRSTNNAGFVVRIYKGDNTTAVNHSFAGNGNSYVCGNNGNFYIGQTSGTEKFELTGNQFTTGNIEATGEITAYAT